MWENDVSLLSMEHDISQIKEPTAREWHGFWTLVAVQAQNAFNEKAVQFLLIPLGVWLWGTGSTLEYSLGAIFVLPYILFSPFVGWLSDCFCKARIIQFMAFLQIIVLGCMLICFYQHDIHWSIVWFSIFAIQATILSPAKKGIVKDMLGSKYIGFGSTIIETSMVIVLLAAQIGVFMWYSSLLEDSRCAEFPDGDGWHAAIVPTIVFLGVAVPVALASLLLPRYEINQTRAFGWSLFYEHFMQIKYLWKDRLLRLSELGISYFWGLAGSLFLIIIQIAKLSTVQEEDFSQLCGVLMAWLGGGVVVGGGAASLLCRRKNELGLIPLGALGVTISCGVLSLCEPNTWASCIALGCAGAFGAAYLAPLNAFLQDHCDPAHRGNIIAAGNLIDNLMGLVAVGVMLFLTQMGVSPQGQFFVLFLLSVLITVISLRLIPQEFIRMIGVWFMKCLYRARILNEENLPEVGGALLVVNHVTYVDALILSMISRRPIRFIVAEEFVAVRFVGWILEIFNSLPISSKKPREAILRAVHGLREGDLICLFPEGQLTRTGCLTPVRRGLEVIAHRAKVPIIPIYMDGLWGSIFSYFRNRFFTKIPQSLPYRFSVAVGRPISSATATGSVILQEFRRLSCLCLKNSTIGGKEAILLRLERFGESPLVFAEGKTLNGVQIAATLISRKVREEYSGALKLWLETLLETCRDLVALSRFCMNAEQLTRVNALEPGVPLLTTVGFNEPQESVVSVLWPILTLTPVHLIASEDDALNSGIAQIAGGLRMRKLLLSVIPPRQVPFYDFSGGADISTPNTRWRPCFITPQGIVLAMSMARSVYKLSDGTVQLGMRARTRGMLLPGFRVSRLSPACIKGPALNTPYSLPSHMYLDESGFFAELSRNS